MSPDFYILASNTYKYCDLVTAYAVSVTCLVSNAAIQITANPLIGFSGSYAVLNTSSKKPG